jgi:hypothetical protein
MKMLHLRTCGPSGQVGSKIIKVYNRLASKIKDKGFEADLYKKH